LPAHFRDTKNGTVLVRILTHATVNFFDAVDGEVGAEVKRGVRVVYIYYIRNIFPVKF
jgi:hypothetical protein